jgi:hypothetical protein
MADSIVRLKVDSQEYDQKLRRAAEGLQRYADGCRQVGGTLRVVEDETLAFVRAVGQMDTVSRSATGKLGEMKRTFTELASQYKQLTDEEKQSPFGKALAQSLDQLKTRINDSKGQLDDINKELNGSGGLSGALDAVAGKFGLNIGELTKFGGAMAAATTALKVAKDAFFASESSVDEWGRTVAASESVYEGFLNAINNGDISGYLSRIDQIVDAARKAYDELDRLGTMKTIQSPQMDRQNAENVRLRMMLMTGKYIAPAAGSGLKATKAEGTLLTPTEIKTLERQLHNGMQNIVKLTGNELKQTGKAIDAYYNKLAKQNGMTMAEFRKGTSSMAEFDKRVKGAKAYDEFEAKRRQAEVWAMSGHNLSYDQAAIINQRNPYAQYKGWSTFRVDKQGENSYNELVGLIRLQQQQTQQMYSNIGQAYRTINRADNRISGGGGGGGNTKDEVEAVSGSIDEQTKLVQELQKAWRAAADDDSRQKIKAEIEEQQYLLDRMTGKEKFNPANMRELTDLRGTTAWATSMEDMKRGKDGKWYDATAPVAPSELTFSDGLQNYMKYVEKLQVDAYKNSAKKDGMEDSKKVTSGLNEVASGLQQMGITLPQEVQKVLGVINGIMTVIEGVNTIIGVTQAAELTANTAAMVALTSALWANTATSIIPGFARGGIVPHAANGYYVPGNKYSGDTTPIMANAGELVLNRAQQGNLAAQLEGNNLGNLQLEAIVYAEQLRFLMRNNSKRRGKGEYITSKMRY